MKDFKSTLFAAVLTLSICSVASAGTITGSRAERTGTITGSKAGTITGSRAGTITGSRAGTITGSRAGTITGSRSEDDTSLDMYRHRLLVDALNVMFRFIW